MIIRLDLHMQVAATDRKICIRNIKENISNCFNFYTIGCTRRCGTVITSEPSLAVAAANTVGNVFPPSVDNKIFTVAQFTEPALVPFTFHVTVAVLPAFHVTCCVWCCNWKRTCSISYSNYHISKSCLTNCTTGEHKDYYLLQLT